MPIPPIANFSVPRSCLPDELPGLCWIWLRGLFLIARAASSATCCQRLAPLPAVLGDEVLTAIKLRPLTPRLASSPLRGYAADLPTRSQQADKAAVSIGDAPDAHGVGHGFRVDVLPALLVQDI